MIHESLLLLFNRPGKLRIVFYEAHNNFCNLIILLQGAFNYVTFSLNKNNTQNNDVFSMLIFF